MAWCGYKGIIRDVVYCLKVCNGCLFSWLAATACHAKKEQVEWPTGSLDCRCVSGCAQDLLVFPLLREKPRGPCCLVGLSPIGNHSLPRSVGLFLFLSAFFFWIPASLILFFSPDDEFLVLSLFGILLYFEAMGGFCHAMLVCYTLLCYNLYITIRCVLVHLRVHVSFSLYPLFVSSLETIRSFVRLFA